MTETWKDFHEQTTRAEDIPPKATWDGQGWQNKVTEYRGFKIGVPNLEFPYMLGIETVVPRLQGLYTKMAQAKIAIDTYLDKQQKDFH
jgi:hypothetical protein